LNDRDLILATANLARRAPDEWAKFMEAFGDYVEDKIVNCVEAPPEMLPIAQGRAQSLVKLGQLLGDCLKTAEAIINSANKAAPSTKQSRP
jgi:hypothetical protein